MTVTKALAARVGELPTEQVRLLHGTLIAREAAVMGKAERLVLAATTRELTGRGVSLCPYCTGMTSRFTTGHVHTPHCPAAEAGSPTDRLWWSTTAHAREGGGDVE